MPKNGYLYAYCSNESNINVFFDNLEVIRRRSQILQENHYYPFGLTMAGISSKAAGGNENKYRLTGKEIQNNEFSDGSGLGEYDYGARFYEPQIGRWFTLDPLSENYSTKSPFNFSENNPVNKVDLDGRAASPIYDENGNFLGTDDEGFKGEVLFQSKALYNLETAGGTITQTHKQALAISATIDEALVDPTQQKIDMVTNAINDVVSKTNEKGFEMSQLKNGAISSYYAEGNTNTNNIDIFNSNGGTSVGNIIPAHTSPNADANGQYTMTFNIGPTSLIARKTDGVTQGTVENIQNVVVHEGKGHIRDKVPNDGVAHSKAYESQMNHSTYKNTTSAFKARIYETYKAVKAGKL